MIALEYAKALYELSLENEKVDEIHYEFTTFVEAIKQEEDIIKVLTYPKIKNNSKKDVINNICKDFNEIFVNFLNVLVDNDRLGNLFEMYTQFEKIVSEHKNIVNISAYSTIALTKEQIDDLEQKLKSRFVDKKIIIKNIVEPLIIGGLKIVYNGQSIDLSLQNKIDQLKASL